MGRVVTAIVFGLCALTGLSWYAAQLMPDILMLAFVLAFAVLAFQSRECGHTGCHRALARRRYQRPHRKSESICSRDRDTTRRTFARRLARVLLRVITTRSDGIE